MGQEIKESSIDKKEKRKEIIWKIIPIALYFIFLCCLLFSYFSTPIFVIVVLIVVGIMVLLNVLCWKKYGKSMDNELTIDRIMDTIRKEGYYPEKLDEDIVQFKIQGMRYRIYYSESAQLSVYTILQIHHDDIQLFKEISWDVTQEYFLHRTVIFSSDEGDYIGFYINSFTTSYSDFRQFLPSYISAIDAAISMTRNLDYQRKSDKEQLQQSEQAFISYMPKNIKS